MGVLTDIFIANKEEAEAIAVSVSPWNKWQGIDAKGHNDITLGALFCILQGKDYDLETLDEFPFLAQESEEGPWVFEIPNELIIALTKLSDDHLPEIVSKWLKTGEMGDLPFDDAKNFIKDLKGLAQETLSQQKNLLMWICL